ncbi:hypothetical protein Tco_1494737 [Tanacetum coccineum]
MEEYIRLEEEKARKHGKVFNWQTTTYGKIRIDDDLHNLSFVEDEFPAILINDSFATQDALQYKSQVSTPVNDEIDFRISFDEFDDEDYIIICDKTHFLVNTVDTAYSLNEYNIFETGINMAYLGDLVKKILTNIGGEFTNLKDLEVLES